MVACWLCSLAVVCVLWFDDLLVVVWRLSACGVTLLLLGWVRVVLWLVCCFSLWGSVFVGFIWFWVWYCVFDCCVVLLLVPGFVVFIVVCLVVYSSWLVGVCILIALL